jgi:hypothetical protein
MVSIIETPQPSLVDVGVDLCGRDIGVTEHHLNGAKIGSVL